jgi:hypothetical protein
MVHSKGQFLRLWQGDGIDYLPGTEPRLWVRYPCDVAVACQAAARPEDTPQLARVRNISLGGIKLLVDRPFERGAAVSIELPGPSEGLSSTVLATVVRTAPGSKGEWEIGCTFATELTDEELDSLGTRRVPTTPPDRRKWARSPCPVQATFRPLRTREPEVVNANVADISPSGIGLFSPRRVEPGILLTLELRGQTDLPPLTILACVVRLRTVGDGTWLLGCNFIRELREPELRGLLEAPRRA